MYGNPDVTQRNFSWYLYEGCTSLGQVRSCVGEDFNKLLLAHEKKGGPRCNLRQIEAFRKALDDCGLEDLGCLGDPYTWHRKHGDDFLRERLDRCITNLEWKDAFPLRKAHHLDLWSSDHRQLLLVTDDKKCVTRASKKLMGRRFMFDAAWCDEEVCRRIVERNWSSQVSSALQNCATALSDWGKSKYRYMRVEIESSRKLLERLTNS